MATDGNNSCAAYTTASEIDDEMSTAKVFAQTPCRNTQENNFAENLQFGTDELLLSMRDELDNFVNTNLPAILFIDE